MDTIAAITTPKGIAAISSIELVGAASAEIIRKVFVPVGAKRFDLIAGSLFVGKIVDGGVTIDHVVLACLDSHIFEIGCHGNPLIVEKVMTLLAVNGARLILAEELFSAKLEYDPSKDAIEVEAWIAGKKAATLAGVKLINNQPVNGLGKVAADWLVRFEDIDLDDIKSDCERVLADSKAARFLTDRVKAVIAGPPNSGKSTLLNALAGKQKAIVTDVAGTTRDWVSTAIKTDEMLIEFFDTAGIDKVLMQQSDTDAASQNTAEKLLAQADIVLFVVDQNQVVDMSQFSFPAGKKTILVLNKSDIGEAVEVNVKADSVVSISAKKGVNVDKLVEAILDVVGLRGFDVETAICFMRRQCKLLQQLIDADNKATAKSLISQLINGPVFV